MVIEAPTANTWKEPKMKLTMSLYKAYKINKKIALGLDTNKFSESHITGILGPASQPRAIRSLTNLIMFGGLVCFIKH